MTRCRRRRLCIVTSAVMMLSAAAGRALPPVTQRLAIALDGSAVTTSGSAVEGLLVEAWIDQATVEGGAQTLTPYSSSAKPGYLSGVLFPGQRTHSIVTWDGSANQCLWLDQDEYFHKGRNLDIEHYTWFVVMKCNRVDATLGLLENYFFSDHHGSSMVAGGVARSYYLDSNDDIRLDTSGIQAGTWYILSCVLNAGRQARNGQLARAFTQFVMTEAGERSAPVSLAVGTSNDTMLHYATAVGAKVVDRSFPPRPISTTSFDGAMAEVLIYTDCLLETDRLAVESYLYEKYFGKEYGPAMMVR